MEYREYSVKGVILKTPQQKWETSSNGAAHLTPRLETL
jgi:hypothetical protein